jgi:hypothetical protein
LTEGGTQWLAAERGYNRAILLRTLGIPMD